MEIIKIVGIALIALVIIIMLKQYRPEYAIFISILTGVLILILVMDRLTGIINLIQSIEDKFSINTQFIALLIKITGIAFLSEFAVSICKDSGETAIASKIEIGSKIIIISMSIPIISSLLEIILKILPWFGYSSVRICNTILVTFEIYSKYYSQVFQEISLTNCNIIRIKLIIFIIKIKSKQINLKLFKKNKKGKNLKRRNYEIKKK